MNQPVNASDRAIGRVQGDALLDALQELLALARETEETLIALDALIGIEDGHIGILEAPVSGAVRHRPGNGVDAVQQGSVEWERRVDELMQRLESVMARRAELAAAISELKGRASTGEEQQVRGLLRAIQAVDGRSLERGSRQLAWWRSELEQIRLRRAGYQGYRSSLGKARVRAEFVDRRI